MPVEHEPVPLNYRAKRIMCTSEEVSFRNGDAGEGERWTRLATRVGGQVAIEFAGLSGSTAAGIYLRYVKVRRGQWGETAAKRDRGEG